MKLTDKQQAVYDKLVALAVNSNITPQVRTQIRTDLDMNPVSYGLILKALADKSILNLEKDGSVVVFNQNTTKSAPAQAPKAQANVTPTKPIVVAVMEDSAEEDSETVDMFEYKAEDFNQNMFFELKATGARFKPSDYTFSSKDSAVIKSMKDIIAFYEASSDTLTDSQRKLRNAMVEKHNLDMECKKIGNKIYFMNTWGLADLKAMVKDITKLGRKNVKIVGNKVVVEIDGSNN